jgi:hypothetical protein
METFKLNLKIIFMASFIGMITLSFNSEQDKSEKLFYYAFDEKVQIDQVADKLLIKKKEALKKSSYEETMKQIFDQVEIEWINANISKVKIKDAKNIEGKINKLLSDDDIKSVRKVYKTKDNLEFGFIDEIIIKFKDEIKESVREEILEMYNLKKSKTTKIYESVLMNC